MNFTLLTDYGNVGLYVEVLTSASMLALPGVEVPGDVVFLV